MAAPVFISIVMYPAICRCDEQAFDNISEESEKKPLTLRNHCGLFQVKAWLSRPKNMATSDSREVTRETPKDHMQREVAEDCLLKYINK